MGQDCKVKNNPAYIMPAFTCKYAEYQKVSTKCNGLSGLENKSRTRLKGKASCPPCQ